MIVQFPRTRKCCRMPVGAFLPTALKTCRLCTAVGRLRPILQCRCSLTPLEGSSAERRRSWRTRRISGLWRWVVVPRLWLTPQPLWLRSSGMSIPRRCRGCWCFPRLCSSSRIARVGEAAPQVAPRCFPVSAKCFAAPVASSQAGCAHCGEEICALGSPSADGHASRVPVSGAMADLACYGQGLSLRKIIRSLAKWTCYMNPMPPPSLLPHSPLSNGSFVFDNVIILVRSGRRRVGERARGRLDCLLCCGPADGHSHLHAILLWGYRAHAVRTCMSRL